MPTAPSFHRRSWFLAVGAMALAASLGATGRGSPPAPQDEPRLQPDALSYLGSFQLPTTDGTDGPAGRLTYGGAGLGIAPNGGLYLVGHAQTQPARVCEVGIPDIGGTAAIRQPCTDITEGRQSKVDNGQIRIGSTLAWNGRLIASLYSYYDANNTASRSHVAGSLDFARTGDVVGPVEVGAAGAAFVGGYMTPVPPEWRGPLGGPVLTGLCCVAILSRTSYGPALSVFDPDDIDGSGRVGATELLGYPEGQALAPYNARSTLWNISTRIVGVAFPPGTRSVLFFGRQGTGPYCYGSGEACKDPVIPYKGVHAYPYQHQVWAYDAADLLAVKQGKRQPSDLKPYGVWKLNHMNDDGSASMEGATYDPGTGRVYITPHYGEKPVVHVYQIAVPPTTTP